MKCFISMNFYCTAVVGDVVLRSVVGSRNVWHGHLPVDMLAPHACNSSSSNMAAGKHNEVCAAQWRRLRLAPRAGLSDVTTSTAMARGCISISYP